MSMYPSSFNWWLRGVLRHSSRERDMCVCVCVCVWCVCVCVCVFVCVWMGGCSGHFTSATSPCPALLGVLPESLVLRGGRSSHTHTHTHTAVKRAPGCD